MLTIAGRFKSMQCAPRAAPNTAPQSSSSPPPPSPAVDLRSPDGSTTPPLRSGFAQNRLVPGLLPQQRLQIPPRKTTLHPGHLLGPFDFAQDRLVPDVLANSGFR